ncbi:MAG: tRNA (adenosine(37)-N6)-dimethylallyltransferase MiaA, partial [Candidatus Omnitrophica bacterium]|nr:tRNA (adenosine(37)-N6)-dimethylallyltransferase MiaA [Candidatus Omnitrophota bacterium]
MPRDKVIFIVGPTAVGKSAAAYAVAEYCHHPQIVSCDSVQVYRELDIVSNKPSTDLLTKIPHHLVNIISVAEQFDVFRFNQLARTAIRTILAQGGTPLVVGGSGLYMKILLDGIFSGEGADAQLRERLLQDAQELGRAHLHQRLVGLDPAAAAKIHPNDLKKVVRALEVYLLDRRPISEKQRECEGIWDLYDVRLIGLNEDRQILYQRINRRVEAMIEAGALEELRRLKGREISSSASGIIGLREIFSYLDGERSLEQAIELMKRNTRRFAKRQLTWYR